MVRRSRHSLAREPRDSFSDQHAGSVCRVMFYPFDNVQSLSTILLSLQRESIVAVLLSYISFFVVSGMVIVRTRPTTVLAAILCFSGSERVVKLFRPMCTTSNKTRATPTSLFSCSLSSLLFSSTTADCSSSFCFPLRLTSLSDDNDIHDMLFSVRRDEEFV